MLVDSNILVYAINSLSPKHKIAKDFLKNNSREIAVAHQNIFETLRILTHPKFLNPMKPTPAAAVVKVITSKIGIISPNYKTCDLALELIKKYSLSSDLIFDAYLVATALSNSIDTIATDNIRDFKKFAEIKVVNPFSADVIL